MSTWPRSLKTRKRQIRTARPDGKQNKPNVVAVAVAVAVAAAAAAAAVVVEVAVVVV